MLNSGKKINILTLVLSEKKILNETKNHNTPCKLNGRSLIEVHVPRQEGERSCICVGGTDFVSFYDFDICF